VSLSCVVYFRRPSTNNSTRYTALHDMGGQPSKTVKITAQDRAILE
jgi:hypothetical protein